MTSQFALDLVYKAIFTAGKMSAPILVTAIVMGVFINILQTITSVKDMSLTFVPKALAAAVIVGISMPWGIEVIRSYFEEMYTMFPMVTP